MFVLERERKAFLMQVLMLTLLSETNAANHKKYLVTTIRVCSSSRLAMTLRTFLISGSR
jgi:hypothetical protein